jgi:hypothetical protein
MTHKYNATYVGGRFETKTKAELNNEYGKTVKIYDLKTLYGSYEIPVSWRFRMKQKLFTTPGLILLFCVGFICGFFLALAL